MMESFLLENKGVQIETSPGLGRVVIATQDFDDLYTEVIREKPALIWPIGSNEYQGCANFLNAFFEATEEIQTSIKDMFHPPLSSSTISPLSRWVILLARQHSNNAELIPKLLAIMTTNAHEYYGHGTSSSSGDLRQFEGVDISARSPSAALFLYASKVQHSCNPNLSYTSKTEDGALVYKVSRPIKAGEAVSFSYLESPHETPTFERRLQLQRTKSFLCMCDCCRGPDYCRVASCPKCGALQPCATTDGTSDSWSCIKCGVQDEVRLAEQRFLMQLEQASVKRAEAPTAPLIRIRKNISTELSPTHFIAVRAWKNLATQYASKAAFLEQIESFTVGMPSTMPQRQMKAHMTEGLSMKQLRQKAAIAGLRSIALSECVASECHGCEPGMFKHIPLYLGSTPMFHACMDLIEIPANMRPPYAKEMVKRYLPVLRGQFGDNDRDVAAIEQKVIRTISSGCHQCDFCGHVQSKLMACGRCKLAYYCEKECQKSDWKDGHKAQCCPTWPRK